MIFLYADEDIPLPLVRALKLQKVNTITTQESGMIGKTDDEQLRYATLREAILFTHNVKHFVQLHDSFQAQKIGHRGIIVSKKDSVGVLLRKMLHLNSVLRMEDMKDRLEYLHQW